MLAERAGVSATMEGRVEAAGEAAIMVRGTAAVAVVAGRAGAT